MSPSGNQDFVKINSSIGLIHRGSGFSRVNVWIANDTLKGTSASPLVGSILCLKQGNNLRPNP
jgi:hypothetical protein